MCACTCVGNKLRVCTESHAVKFLAAVTDHGMDCIQHSSATLSLQVLDVPQHAFRSAQCCTPSSKLKRMQLRSRRSIFRSGTLGSSTCRALARTNNKRREQLKLHLLPLLILDMEWTRLMKDDSERQTCQTYLQTYIHTYIHTYIQTYRHTESKIQTYRHTGHTDIHPSIHPPIHLVTSCQKSQE